MKKDKEKQNIINIPINDGAKVKYIKGVIQNGVIDWQTLQRIELLKLLILLKGLLKQSRLNHVSIINAVEQTERILNKIFIEKGAEEDFFTG